MSAHCDAMTLHESDDVAVALRHLPMNTSARIRQGSGFLTLTVTEPIDLGHKLALRDIVEGSTVRKYGEAIGQATAAIRAGGHVHVHNLVSLRGRTPR